MQQSGTVNPRLTQTKKRVQKKWRDELRSCIRGKLTQVTPRSAWKLSTNSRQSNCMTPPSPSAIVVTCFARADPKNPPQIAWLIFIHSPSLKKSLPLKVSKSKQDKLSYWGSSPGFNLSASFRARHVLAIVGRQGVGGVEPHSEINNVHYALWLSIFFPGWQVRRQVDFHLLWFFGLLFCVAH